MHNTPERYRILFEPVQIGPVTAPNRFYQVPHCSGMGHRYPDSDRRLRVTKAEGGWGVVSTQETEIHPNSDITPSNQNRIWDKRDVTRLKQLTDEIHQHGSLAAMQLVHNGKHATNRLSRLTAFSPSLSMVTSDDPVQVGAMSKSDIKHFRKMHREAAIRAKQAGFDIIYVYAGHDLTLLQHFLLNRHNQRTDEYGGSFENRLRLFREVIADTRDAIGDTCALAIRFAVEELLGDKGIRHNIEGHDIVQALANEPDLWDVNLSNWANDSQTARFADEGFQEHYIRFVKPLTVKPVVGVGRYTSPDAMVRAIQQGIFDLVGSARASIADPFLPNKVKEGNLEEIRECIGCNICVASDKTSTPLRCTQNPTIGEEFRKQWHPERVPSFAQHVPEVLIVGGGPAGLEAARVFAQRGANVIITDAKQAWGGRLIDESRLPGMASYGRVRDWRLQYLQQASNVSMYLDNHVERQTILEFGIKNVVLATGSHWRDDAVGRYHTEPVDFLKHGALCSVNDWLQHQLKAIGEAQSVVIFDDDRYYLATIIAEMCAQAGIETTIVTPSPIVAAYTRETLEYSHIMTRLMSLGVKCITQHQLAGRSQHDLSISCIFSGRVQTLACDVVIPVTSRLPNKTLWDALDTDDHTLNVLQIGDCLAPSTVQAATYAGYKLARTFGDAVTDDFDGYR